jgi:hypothetical protein
MINIPYTIGKKYKHYSSDKIFILKQVKKFIFEFECGYCCTDNVFIDLLDISVNRQVYELMPSKQLELF